MIGLTEPALTDPATTGDRRSAQRPALTVRIFSSDWLWLLRVIIKIFGVSGVAGASPSVTPVEDTSPGPGPVSRETVPSTIQAVLESPPRQWTVTTPTQVFWSPRTTRRRSSSPPPWRLSRYPPSPGVPECGTLWQGQFCVAGPIEAPQKPVTSSNLMEMAGSRTPPLGWWRAEWLTPPGTLQVAWLCWAVTTVRPLPSSWTTLRAPVISHWTIPLCTQLCLCHQWRGRGHRYRRVRQPERRVAVFRDWVWGISSFLNEGRQYHACARYTDPFGKNVKI